MTYRLENVDEKVEDACVEDIYVVCGVFVILDYWVDQIKAQVFQLWGNLWVTRKNIILFNIFENFIIILLFRLRELLKKLKAAEKYTNSKN